MKRLAILMLTGVLTMPASAQNTFSFGTKVNPQGSVFEVDSRGFIVDGKHKLPVMGEIHYSRVPQADWQREIRKMKAGGITILATYCFWLHHEPQENHWNWSGSNDLHRFLEVCREENMPVILRIGPFCHGEVYHGGMPDWVIEKAQRDPKQYKQRSLAPGFMAATRRLYSNIFAQVNDMLWKDGGPIVGVQIENECRGPWDYYMALKKMAIEIGFDAPFYTRTGWPKLNGKETFGEMLPLYSDYADGFWDRSLTDMPGDYPKAFCMKDARISATVATETFGKDALTDNGTKEESNGGLSYPYLTCELGGGMMPSYHRRINMTGCEPLPLAICKLGSGSNLLGYYMYHGGTNPSYDAVYNFTTPSVYTPDGHTTAETQASLVTNYNDMPLMTYDFQCPLGEMGQPNLNAFHQTRWLHQFLADWGEELSQMDVDTLSEHYARRGCFEFFNDYVRIINEGGRAYIRPVKMPFQGHTITADAQPFCKVGSTLYFIPIKGMKPTVVVDGKKCVPYKAKTFGDITVQVLTEDNARRAYKIDGELVLSVNPNGILYKDGNDVVCEYWNSESDRNVDYRQTSEASAPRAIPMGRQKVAAMPGNDDFKKAAVWSLDLHVDADDNMVDDCFLEVSYSADCARLYADGRLVEDNFWNGKPMLVRMSDLVKEENGRKVQKQVELRILPLAKDAPIYLQKAQREELQNADASKGLLTLHGIKVIQRVTKKQ